MQRLTYTSDKPGKLTVPHGWGVSPQTVISVPLSAGLMWFQQPVEWDDKNLYLVASDAGVVYRFDAIMPPAAD